MNRNILTITVALVGFSLTTLAQAQGSLDGAWQLQETTVSGGNNDGTDTDTLGFVVFSEGHYSSFSNFGERPDFTQGEPLTDDQVAAAFESFRANAGTYEVSGSSLTLHLMLARHPAAVDAMAEREYSVEGDTLTMIATNAEGVVTTTTHTRVD